MRLGVRVEVGVKVRINSTLPCGKGWVGKGCGGLKARSMARCRLIMILWVTPEEEHEEVVGELVLAHALLGSCQ